MRALVVLLVAFLVLWAWLVISVAEKGLATGTAVVETIDDRAVAWTPTIPATTTTTSTLPPTTTTTVVARARTAPIKRAAAAGAVPDLIRQGFARFGHAIAEQAVRVAGCETGHTYDPGARSGQHAGLFQLARRWQESRVRRLGFSWAQMFEAGPNIAVAVDLYAEQGWRPWTCRRAA